MLDTYLPILIFVLIVLGLIGALVTLSFVLGPAKPFRRKLALVLATSASRSTGHPARSTPSPTSRA